VFYLSPGFSANFQTMDGLKNAFFKGRLNKKPESFQAFFELFYV
jgi:hypothetical protein